MGAGKRPTAGRPPGAMAAAGIAIGGSRDVVTRVVGGMDAAGGFPGGGGIGCGCSAPDGGCGAAADVVGLLGDGAGGGAGAGACGKCSVLVVPTIRTLCSRPLGDSSKRGKMSWASDLYASRMASSNMRCSMTSKLPIPAGSDTSISAPVRR